MAGEHKTVSHSGVLEMARQFSYRLSGKMCLPALLLCCIVVYPAFAQSGGEYSIVRSTISSGGGTSSGGQYILTGTIGQPVTTSSAAAQYHVQGGFWPGKVPVCFVDFTDFARFAAYWSMSEPDSRADLNGNGLLDIVDLSYFVNAWLCPCSYSWPLR
jgi:hypothetical protein